MRALFVCFTALVMLSCDDPSPGAVQSRGLEDLESLNIVPPHDEHHEDEPQDPAYWSSAPIDPLTAYDCAESKDTGYVKGDSFAITVVKVDGKPVEVQTANAFLLMRGAAAKDGVNITVVSGFRTNAEQQYLYNCYINCNCNNCNLAAKPGYSNHQSGHAIDLNAGGAGVYNWMATHGGSYGWEETVASENWHWEWWGGGPAASGPCGQVDYKATYVGQSFPLASMPGVEVKSGESFAAWIDLKNEGTATWTGNTFLAPTPRDVASPLHDVSWISPTRITGPDADTPSGGVGRFSFNLAGGVPGEYFQTFGLVEEGVTWFSDAPKGGGPPDTQLEVRVMVLEPDPAPPDGTTTGEPGTTSSGEVGSVSDGETTATTTATTATATTADTADTGASAGESGAGDADGEPTGPGGQDSGDMSEGFGGPGGAALPDGYGSDEGCGCRSSGGGARGVGDLGVSGLAFGLLLWTRRRRVGA